MCGVYYLWDGTSVLYIGASTNVVQRLRHHWNEGIDFAGFFLDQCDKSELADKEARAIIEFRPRFNEQMRFHNA